MNAVLIISPDVINNNMAGPGIRYWNLAHELSKHLRVILLTPNKCNLQAEFTIEQFNKETDLKYSRSVTSILVQGVSLWKHPFLKKLNIPIIVDLYDLFIFENFEVNFHENDASHLHKAALSVLLDQLKYGDYFICASEKQKDFWL